MAQYVKLNEEPIEIENIEVEETENENLVFEEGFEWDGRNYFLSDFIRTHNNPYIGGIKDCPDYIHGYWANDYWSPLFIEIVNGEAVNVYECKEDE